MNDPIPRVIFYSSKSENTLRAVNKLAVPSIRLPLTKAGPFPSVEHEYVLIVPTFGAGRSTVGAVPQPVREFLRLDPSARDLCVGVISGGNTTFSQFAQSGDLLSEKLGVPLLYKFEVLGMPHEIRDMREILFNLFPDLEDYRNVESETFAHPSAFF